MPSLLIVLKKLMLPAPAPVLIATSPFSVTPVAKPIFLPVAVMVPPRLTAFAVSDTLPLFANVAPSTAKLPPSITW